MSSLQDAVYNWLTIKLVKDDRPDDVAAIETTKFFRDILTSEFQVKELHIQLTEEMYIVSCEFDNDDKLRSFRFPVDLINCILEQIDNEPEKFPIYH
jgi:hypothetical protein